MTPATAKAAAETGSTETGSTETGPASRQADVAYARIKEAVIRGEYPPGHQALEQELALRLGMSRTPIREALVRLAQERYIELIPRRGMRVTELSARAIREINEVLGGLEAQAAERLASRKLSPGEQAQLDAAIAAMDRALEADDMAAWSEADYRFHRLLIELCGNRTLIEIATQLLEKAHRFRVVSTPQRGRPVYSNVNHAAVVEAIRRGDPQTAVEIHRSHKRRWSRELTDILDRLDIGE